MSKDYSVPLWKDFIIGTHQHEQLLAKLADSWGDSDHLSRMLIRDFINVESYEEVKEMFSTFPKPFVKFVQAICCSGLRAALLPVLKEEVDEAKQEEVYGDGDEPWRVEEADEDWWRDGPVDRDE